MTTKGASKGLEYMIAGIGNAGMPYTRHSVGLLMVENLARSFGVQLKRHGREKVMAGKTTVRILQGSPREQDVQFIFANSLEPMNFSGPPIANAMRALFTSPAKAPRGKKKSDDNAQKLILIHDSIDHDVLDIKPKLQGSAKGHNGVKSVIKTLGTDEFARVRLGIGQYDRGKKGQDMAEFVLGELSGSERKFWTEPEPAVPRVWAAIEGLIKEQLKNRDKVAREVDELAEKIVEYELTKMAEKQKDLKYNIHGLRMPKS